MAAMTMKTRQRFNRYEVATDADCLLIPARSHDEAKEIAEGHGHKVYYTANVEPDAYVSDEVIWDRQGYLETIS